MTTNYADDNALSYVHRNAETVIHRGRRGKLAMLSRY